MVLSGYLAETVSVTTTLLVIAIAYVVTTTAQYANPAPREMDRPRRAGPDEAAPEQPRAQ
ncbi:MAG: hypothetical protein ACYCX3_10635 [Thermoleophilia bacterium]